MENKIQKPVNTNEQEIDEQKIFQEEVSYLNDTIEGLKKLLDSCSKEETETRTSLKEEIENYEKLLKTAQSKLDQTTPQTKDNSKYEAMIEKIVDILKTQKLVQFIVAGEEFTDPEAKKLDKDTKEKIFQMRPDHDARGALELFNNYNTKTLSETYAEGAVTSLVTKENTGYELIEDKKGYKLIVDTGGEWIKLIVDGETTTIWLDHHGEGKREPTCGTKIIYELMQKAGILKEKPEWLDKFVNSINELDNLTYVENKDATTGKKTFTKEYFENTWPKTFYALAEKVPFKTLFELFKSGAINDFSTPLTDEQLNEKIGKLEANDITLSNAIKIQSKKIIEKIKILKKELFNEGKVKSEELPFEKEELNELGQLKLKMTIDDWTEAETAKAKETDGRLVVTDMYAKKEGLKTHNTTLGNIYYHNFKSKINGTNNKQYPNVIENSLAFKGAKALGFDTYISWNKQKGKFFINSNHPDLSKIVEQINERYPGCAVDVRGVMVFGKIKGDMTEEGFLNVIDSNISKNAKEGAIDNVPIVKESENQEPKETWTIEDQKRLEELKKRIIEIDALLKKLKGEEERPTEPTKTGKAAENTNEEDLSKIKENLNKTYEKEQKPNNIETKLYTGEYIKEKINNLLEKNEAIKKINEIKIEIKNNEALLKLDFEAKKKSFGFSINVKGVISTQITNNGNEITALKPDVQATPTDKVLIETFLTPELKKISEKLKEFIGKEEGKKVEKINIKDGKLEVVFG